MNAKSNTKFIILLSFGMVLLLLVSLIAIAINSISTNQQQVLNLKNHSETESLVYQMRDSALKRSLSIFRMTATEDPFDRDDLWMEFNSMAQFFIEAKDVLEAEKLDPKSKEYLNKAIESAGPGAKAQNEAIRMLVDNEDLVKAKEILNEEVIPHQNNVLSSMTSLLHAVRDDIGISIERLSTENLNSILLISVLGGIAVILGVLIAVYVIRRATRSEQVIIEQKEIAEQANNAKSMFLANMSHEIRSPLTAIIGFSDSILHRDMDDERKRELTQSIVRNSNHLHQIINDILDISKIEAGQLDIETVRTSIGKLCCELNSMVSLQTEKKGLVFNINLNFPLPEFINTDPTRLKQILVNLTNNATKFTNEGGITLGVSYDIDSDKIHFSVSDTGIGMTTEQASSIFSAFSQADSSTTRKFGGTGLGLSISKQLSEKLGGEISCQSEIGKGSTFSFYVSAGRLSDTKMLFTRDELKIEKLTHSYLLKEKLKGHVLLAEDTKDNQDLIEMYVLDTGAKITIVENGKLAVEACQKENYDLIFMDMQMPVMDGVEAITQIRANGINTPIVSLTANAMKSDVDKCFNAGANKFLTKPIEVSRFNQVITEYLEEDKNNTSDQTDSVTPIKKSRSGKMEKIIARFVSDLPRRMTLMENAIEQNNWDAIKAESHNLKGLGTSMGFADITKISSEINDCCLKEEYDELPTLIASLKAFIHTI